LRITAHHFDGVRLVLLYRDYDLADPYHGGEQGRSVEDAPGMLDHQPVIGREVWLALGAVNNENFHLLPGGRRELHVGRECRSPHTHDPVVMHDLFYLFCVEAFARSLYTAPFEPFIFSVRYDNRGRSVDADGRWMHSDRINRSRGRRVDRGRYESARLGDDLSLLHLVALLDDRLRGSAEVLGEEHYELFGQRHLDYRVRVRQPLVIRWMNASEELSASHQASPPAAAAGSSTAAASSPVTTIVFIGHSAATSAGISNP
jgi:hypothetical protein